MKMPGWPFCRVGCFVMTLLRCAWIMQAQPSVVQQSTPPTADSSAVRWLEGQSTHLSPRDAVLLKRAQATILDNVVSSAAWKPYSGVEPSRTDYRGIWNWDAAFHAIEISQWDPQLAREQFNLVFSRQLPSGALPDVILETGDLGTKITKPPVMAWAIAIVDHRSPDLNYLRAMYPKLVRLGNFWLRERGGNTDGLFYYAGVDSGEDSGWDDSIRWDNGYRMSTSSDHRLWAVDLNCYMVMHYRAMAYIADRLHLISDQLKWTKEADALAKRINKKLWDEKIGFFVDRDRTTGADGPALSPAGFMPLFVHIVDSKRAARMEKTAADPQKFFPMMPTAAYDTPGYESHGYWRGSTWLNTSFFALKGLRQYGYSSVADEMRSILLTDVAKDPSIQEYYDSRNGDGYGAAGFGWSAAFTIAFILDWYNTNLTWLFSGK